MTSKTLMMARINFHRLVLYGPSKIMGKMISYSLFFIPFYSYLLLSFICSSCYYSSPPSFLPLHRVITISLSRCFVPLLFPYPYLVYSFPIPLICPSCDTVVLYFNNDRSLRSQRTPAAPRCVFPQA
jgi:hypothetical protein